MESYREQDVKREVLGPISGFFWLFTWSDGPVAGGYRVTEEETRQLGTGPVSVYL